MLHYAWHPLHGTQLALLGVEIRAGCEVVQVEVGGLKRQLPAWMCDAATCAAMSKGPPVISLRALVELRDVLSSLADAESSAMPAKMGGNSMADLLLEALKVEPDEEGGRDDEHQDQL